MRPKGKLFALFAVFAAIGLVTASGAFTTVTADRTAEVNVAGDSAALLQLQSNGTTTDGAVNGSEYVGTTSDGAITINFDGTTDGPIGTGADGLNPNATTDFNSLIDITNQGTQTVDVDISLSVDSSSGTASDAEIMNSVIIEDQSDTDLTSSSVNLGTGSTATLDFTIDSTNSNGGQLGSDDEFTLTITITASGDTSA